MSNKTKTNSLNYEITLAHQSRAPHHENENDGKNTFYQSI